MDELEISGKRYLSTRRAAKDHKYTSDYVGQLIRGGKVVGKKVGRSWYVEEASLNAYLSGENTPAALAVKTAVKEPVVEKEAEAPVAAAAVVAEPETKKKEEERIIEEKVFEPVIIKTNVVEEHHIPIRTPEIVKEKPMGGLRYIVDDEPALPEIKRKPVAVSHNVAVQPVEQAPEEHYASEKEVEVIPHKKIGAVAIAGVVVAGMITLSLTALISTALNSRIVVEEGQVASVGYTFQ